MQISVSSAQSNHTPARTGAEAFFRTRKKAEDEALGRPRRESPIYTDRYAASVCSPIADQ